MTRRWTLLAAAPALTAGIVVASLGVGAATAGKPQPMSALLCGVYTRGTDNMMGNSNQDHFSGASATGQFYKNDSQTCEQKESNGSFSQSSDGGFTWTINHDNVSTASQHGTEHGVYNLTAVQGLVAGFQGHITEYDFTNNGGTQYQSAGNFNTHGGAATGNHFRGTYTSFVYQDASNNNNSPCKAGSGNYCFQANLSGQTN